MGSLFFYLKDDEVKLDDPTRHVKDEYHDVFARRELKQYLLSELCALDQLIPKPSNTSKMMQC